MAAKREKDVEASNTTSSTSQDSIQSVIQSVRYSGSEDYLEASVYVDWGDTPQVCYAAEFLRGHRQAAELTDKRFVVVPLRGRLIEVKGFGKRGPAVHYDAVIQYKGLTFDLAFRPSRKGKPNVSVCAKSLASMSLGIWEFMRVVQEMIADLGGRFIEGTWKRIDLAVDFAGIAVERFCREYESGHYIARATCGTTFFEITQQPSEPSDDEEEDEEDDGYSEGRGSVHRERKRYSGFAYGSTVLLRVYDKVLEATKKKSDPEKLAFLEVNRFHGQQDVTRVEFQLTGKVLRAVGLQKWSDTGKMREVMATWLVTKWFRMSDCHDRTHTTRAKVLPLWEMVQRGFADVFGKTEQRPKRIKAKPGHMRRLVLQAFGILASAGAALSGVTGGPVSYEQVCGIVREQVADDFLARVDVKRVQRGADLVQVSRGAPKIGDDLDGDFS